MALACRHEHQIDVGPIRTVVSNHDRAPVAERQLAPRRIIGKYVKSAIRRFLAKPVDVLPIIGQVADPAQRPMRLAQTIATANMHADGRPRLDLVEELPVPGVQPGGDDKCRLAQIGKNVLEVSVALPAAPQQHIWSEIVKPRIKVVAGLAED